MAPRREAWQHLPVAEPVSEGMTRDMPETLVGNYEHMKVQRRHAFITVWMELAKRRMVL